MADNKFPAGRDEQRVRSVIDYYDPMTLDEHIADIDLARANDSCPCCPTSDTLTVTIGDITAIVPNESYYDGCGNFIITIPLDVLRAAGVKVHEDEPDPLKVHVR